MRIIDVLEKINVLKKKGHIKTNYYPGVVEITTDSLFFENEKAVVFIVEEPFRKRVFFATVDNDSLVLLLQKVPAGCILEYIYKQENDMVDCFVRGGLIEYTYYIRNTIVWSESPYTVSETGRRKLLQEMYDPHCGEYASQNDIMELYTITKETFDNNCDDIFTLDRWANIIENKECLLYKENNQIIALYVWRLEGKKLYSNISINRGSANILYNLERRVFEEMWDKGIRVYCAWFNKDNFLAINRGNNNAKKYIVRQEIIYNGIYLKQ